jgi:hypothetical protein
MALAGLIVFRDSARIVDFVCSTFTVKSPYIVRTWSRNTVTCGMRVTSCASTRQHPTPISFASQIVTKSHPSWGFLNSKDQLIPYFLSHSLMATEQGKTLQLTCLCEGDLNTFVITLPVTADVSQLRKSVHQNGEIPSNVRVIDVNLWRVCPEFHTIFDLVNCSVWLMPCFTG